MIWFLYVLLLLDLRVLCSYQVSQMLMPLSKGLSQPAKVQDTLPFPRRQEYLLELANPLLMMIEIERILLSNRFVRNLVETAQIRVEILSGIDEVVIDNGSTRKTPPGITP